jgi:hypothetical protein
MIEVENLTKRYGDYRAAAAPMAELGILLEAQAMHTGRSPRNHPPRFGARPRCRVRSLV